MNSAELKRAKRDVRRRVLAARDAIRPEDRERLAAAATERLLAVPEVAAAGTVMAYWSFGSELPTGSLIEGLVARGTRVALPRIVDGELEPRAYRPGDPVTETSFGAREPAGGVELSAGEIDVVVTPAVAFDRSCRRVGYGGGFFDRLFLRTRPDALRAGVGFGVQLLDEDLPGGGFDLLVDVVVTESETVRCGINGDLNAQR